MDKLTEAIRDQIGSDFNRAQKVLVSSSGYNQEALIAIYDKLIEIERRICDIEIDDCESCALPDAIMGEDL